MDEFWGGEKTRWFLTASEYTGFHGRLAELIRPYLSKEDTILDMGCGLGRLDFELAGDALAIDCVDKSENAINLLSQDIEKRGIVNMTASVSDFMDYEGALHDVLILSYFGGGDGYFQRLMKLFSKKAIIIAHDRTGARQRALKKTKKVFAEEIAAWMDANGYTYKREYAELEFGQPFASMDEACSYFYEYAGRSGNKTNLEDGAKSDICVDTGNEDEEKQAFLRRIKPTGDIKYPYYMEKRKQIAIFVVGK